MHFYMKRKQIEYLQSTGYLMDNNGGVILQDTAELLYKNWERYLSATLKIHYENVFKFPILLDLNTLKKSNYINNFPLHIIVARNYGKKRYAEAITPATCFHLYRYLQGQTIKTEIVDLFLDFIASKPTQVTIEFNTQQTYTTFLQEIKKDTFQSDKITVVVN